jgi:leader peptidase (prepilin peptidase) / N-methyltransferase
VTVEVLGEHPLANFREDVKLAPTLGLPPGWLSWGTVAVGVVAAFLLAGLAGMVALGLLRKSRLPFGPWLVVGALPGVLVGGEVAGWFQAASLGAR